MKARAKDWQSILVGIDARGVATLSLNRPERHNAFDPDMSAEICAALESLDVLPRVRVVILTGEGRSFCSGGDIGHMRRTINFTRAQNYRASRQVTRMFYVLRGMRKPTVAKVRGAVRGGGVGLIAACDIAVSASDATYRLSEVRVGMVPAMISPFMVAAIGERQATRYLLSAELFGADEALRVGLVQAVVPDDELDRAVERLTDELRQGAPGALSATKLEVRAAARNGIRPAGIGAAARTIAKTRVGREAQEGLRAFLEKRKPDWNSGEAQPGKPKRTQSTR
jgi:methylglutaconyl-CoA hydratase